MVSEDWLTWECQDDISLLKCYCTSQEFMKYKIYPAQKQLSHKGYQAVRMSSF